MLGRLGVAQAYEPAPPEPSGALRSAYDSEESLASTGARYEPLFSDMLPSPESALVLLDSIGPAVRGLEEYMSQASPHVTEQEEALQLLQSGERLPLERRQEIRENLEQAQPFLDSVRESSERGAFPPLGMPDDPEEAPKEESVPTESEVSAVVENASRLLCLSALDNLAGGGTDALRIASEAADVVSISSNGTMKVQQSQIAGMNEVTDTLAALVRDEDDVRRLMSACREMTAIRERWNEASQRVSSPVARDLLARVADAQQSGFDIDPKSLDPSALVQDLSDAQRERIERIGQRIDEDPELRRRIEERIESQMDQVRSMTEEVLRYRREEDAAKDVGTSVPLNPFVAPETAAMAKIDVLRVETATEAYRRMNDGQTPSDPRLLAPRFIPYPVTDPFTREPFKVNSETGAHYSIGPDGVDDRTTVRYDSTNGALSRGDVFLLVHPGTAAGDAMGED